MERKLSIRQGVVLEIAILEIGSESVTVIKQAVADGGNDPAYRAANGQLIEIDGGGTGVTPLAKLKFTAQHDFEKKTVEPERSFFDEDGSLWVAVE